MDTGAAIVLAVFVAIVVGIITTIILAKLKGKLELRFDNRPYRAGESINGTVIVHANKHIEAERLTASLVCVVYDGRNKKQSHHSVYREKKELFGPRPIAEGGRVEARFGLVLPQALAPGEGLQLPNVAGVEVSRFLTAGIAGGKQSWYIELHLAAKGVDLYHRQGIVIEGAIPAR